MWALCLNLSSVWALSMGALAPAPFPGWWVLVPGCVVWVIGRIRAGRAMYRLHHYSVQAGARSADSALTRVSRVMMDSSGKAAAGLWSYDKNHSTVRCVTCVCAHACACVHYCIHLARPIPQCNSPTTTALCCLNVQVRVAVAISLSSNLCFALRVHGLVPFPSAPDRGVRHSGRSRVGQGRAQVPHYRRNFAVV